VVATVHHGDVQCQDYEDLVRSDIWERDDR
jgi:hypothetical protein